ncbi:MAG TPA: glycosyltransferase family A protein [archaeon]|nr:glycosyltransferase family A protein [archaeon]
MDVTVLIRCYNQEQYLYDCVRRLDGHKYVILSDYPQLGKRARLNEAIRKVDTEWIAFNDADDMSLPDRFGMHEFWAKKYDLIYSDCYILSKTGVTYTRSRKFDRELLKKKNYIPFSSIIVRTELARMQRFETDVEGNGEDWIWLNFIADRTTRFYYRNWPTMIYRDFKPPYGKIPVYRKIKRILWQNKVRSIINARTKTILD